MEKGMGKKGSGEGKVRGVKGDGERRREGGRGETKVEEGRERWVKVPSAQ
jgi:hypothetical protein